MIDTSFTNTSLREPSRFRINTQHFSPHDLSLFVECLETISRLTCAKKARRRPEGKKISSSQNLSKRFETLPDTNPAINRSEPPKTSDGEKSENDETYFSAPSSSQSTPRHNALHEKELCEFSTKSNNSLASCDSEESGVYAMGSTQQMMMSNCETPAKLNSTKASEMHTPSNKLHFFTKIWKKEVGKNNSVKLVARRALDEHETLMLYEQQQQEILKAELQQKAHQKSPRFLNLHLRTSTRRAYALSPGGSSEPRFLDRALRYLTL